MLQVNMATIEALLNATEDSVVLLDLEGRFLTLNQEAARRRSMSVKQLIGKKIYDYLDSSVVEQRKRNILKAIVTRAPVYDNEETRNKYYHVSIYPVKDANGEVVQVASYSRDRTENKQYELKLLKAMELAEAANMAKTQFLANMSHELRTPLNAILGLSQIALAEVEGESRSNFEMIYDSGLRLLNLLNNLLDLAAIERRSIEPNAIDFDIFVFLTSVQKSFAMQAAFNEVELVFDVSPHLPRLLSGDEYRLSQILSNLILNALKVTRGGIIKVGVSGNVIEDSTNNIVEIYFSVEDNGVGIDTEKVSLIFENFTIAEHFLTKQHSGAGIGLGITKSLIEMLGGSIQIQSKKDCGTKIVFHLPFICKEESREDKDQQSIVGKDQLNSKYTILIVEDDPINMLTASRILSKAGFIILEAVNGLEALTVLRFLSVNLILMDIQMPVMDGIQTTSHIRNGEVPTVDRNIPIIAFTAFANSIERERFQQCGMSDFITKPLEMSRLVNLVQQHLIQAPERLTK